MVWSSNEFSLITPVHGFSQSVIENVADGPNGRNGTDLSETFPIANGRKLTTGIRVTP